MRNYYFIILGFIIVSTISCEKTEEVPAITINDFVGSWKATSSVITNNSNSEDEIDIIANGGEVRFTMLNGGGVRTWIIFGSFSDEWDSQAELTSDIILTLTPVDTSRDVSTFEFVLEHDTLILTNHNDSFDFTLSDASEVPATSVTTFIRN